MTGRETHFELFLRKTPKSSWVLVEAVPDRQKAVSKGKELLEAHPHGGVRVLKEQRTASGEFNSVIVTTLGNCTESKPGKSEGLKSAALTICVSPGDLFKPAARKTYQEVLPKFLEKHRVLPGELVYRTDLLDILEASGSELTHAIQKVAIARSGGGDDLHAIARQLHELVTLAISQIFKDRKSGLLLSWQGSLSDVIINARKTKSPSFALGAAIADRLKRQTNWRDKLQALLDIWKETEALEKPDKDFCNDILTHYFSEWIEAPNTLAYMIGKTNHTAEIVHRLIAILEPRSQYLKGPDPLADLPSAQTLAEAISMEVLPSAHNRIVSLIFSEIASNRRLYTPSLQEEFLLLKSFGDRLVKLLGGKRQKEMYDAFCERSKLLMTIDTIEAYLEQFPIHERPQKLLGLSANLAGHDARVKLVSVLRGYISQPQFEVAILGTRNPVMTLSSLRATQVALIRASLPDQDRLHGARDIDTLGVRLLGQSKLFGSMIKKAGTPERAALALFRLAAEALPHGQCARLAASSATQILQSEQARDRLASNPDMKRALAQMAKAANEFTEISVAS